MSADQMLAPVRISVVGAGHWGKNLVRNFATLKSLYSVVDARPAHAASLAETHGVHAQTFEEALRDSQVDAVALATPAAQHAQMTLKALEAGKHVFVEKPIALTVADGQRSIDAALASGKTLMVGHLLQYHPAFIELKNRVEAGEVGQVRYIYSNRMSLGQFRSEENALWSFAPHDLSMILSLARALPASVQALGHSYLNPSIADVTHTHLSFENGINAHVLVSWLHPFKEQKLVVIGDEAMIVFDDTQPWKMKLTQYRHKVSWKAGMPVPIKAEGEMIPLEDAEPLNLECEHFIEMVRTGGTPRTDGREALSVLRVLAAAQQSINERKPVKLTQREDEKTRARSRTMIHESAYVGDTTKIGEGTKVWHFSHIMDGVEIGRNCSFGQNVVVGPDVTIGDNCKVQNNVSIYKGVTLENGVFCGPSCVFTNVLTPRSEINRREEFKRTLVRRGATIGANATIVCGNELGEYCLIAAGSVVTRNVPPYALMAGVPARRIGWVSRSGERLGDDLVCPREGLRYEQTSPDTLRQVGEISSPKPLTAHRDVGPSTS